MQRLNYSRQENKQTNKTFAVYVSDTRVTLKQGQGSQALHVNVDLDRGYNHAKFDRSRFNGVQDKANVGAFSQVRKTVNYFR